MPVSLSRSQCVSLLRRALCATLLCAGVLPSAHAAVQDRLVNGIGTALVALPQNTSPRATHSTDLGAAPANRVLTNLSLRFSMTASQQAALTQLIAAQQNPSSPSYHQWLTPEQYAANFGLSANDLATVSGWLKAQGFAVTSVARSGTFIQFTGTVGQAEQAFHTSLHTVSEAVTGTTTPQQHLANLTPPSLPSGIAAVVQQITGLDDFRPRSHLIRRPVSVAAVHPENTLNTTQGVEHFIAPGDLYTIYDETPLLNNSINGTGITIAVMGEVDITTADVAAFRTAAGLNASNLPTTKTYGPDPGSPTGSCAGNNPAASCTVTEDDLDESLLDVEWAGAAAPDANILFVNSTDVIDISLADAIDNNVAPIMTISYGDCETNYSTSQRNTLNELFQQANVQGITITSAAGDDGATDCDYNVDSATHGLNVDFPASSPYVTGVGGTMFNEGSGSYWNTSNGAYGGSATGYIPEDVWNETAETNSASSPGFSAGGGGVSLYFSKPTWQAGTGVPADGMRDVPDVALNAAANHDGYYVCAEGSCTGGNFYNSSGSFNVYGGTSVATPSIAGMLALVEQKVGSRLGNVNPTLYALAGSTYSASVFHDVTVGNNDSPCTAGSTNCPSGGQIGYTAGVGYDQASGWGSIDAYNLASYWGQASVVTTPVGTAASTTTLTAATATPASGASDAITITVASASGTVTATPTGTLTVAVDGVTETSSLVLTNGAATYPFSSTVAGSHLITAVYSGDGNYATSTGNITVTVASATTTPAFTLAATNVTVAAGSTGTSTVTVTPTGGYTGTVNWGAVYAVPTLTNGCYTIAAVPVSGTAATTATLTVYTTAAGCAAATTAASVQGNAKRKILSRGGTVSAARPVAPGSRPLPLGVTFAGLLALGFVGRRTRGIRIFMVAGLFGLVGFTISGCSSGSSTSSSSTTTDAAQGIYSLTLTGTDGTNTAITASTTFTVTIN